MKKPDREFNKSFVKIIALDEVDSTNAYALRKAEKGAREITVIWARRQTRGRGRLGRRWVSPEGGGLYVSFLLRPSSRRVRPLLGFVAALAVIRALKSMVSVRLKWPNDLLVGEKKIGGILLETQSHFRDMPFVVLGIGINTGSDSGEIPPGATSLYLEEKKDYTHREILYKIIHEFTTLYRGLKPAGIRGMIREVESYMDTLSRDIKILKGNRWVRAHALCLDEAGAILVRTDDGECHKMFPQEVTHLR